jgi:alpha-tubulin suppressor-like RCC1 family protein
LSAWVVAGSGYYHTVAAQSNGTLWAWGNNTYGQLGNNSTTNFSSPVQVGTSLIGWSNISSIVGGYYHTAVLLSNGTLWTWGYNLYGQLGTNNTTNRSVPTQVGGLTSWTKIASGNYHIVAGQNNGTLWAWGLNSYGQLGTSNQTNYSSPVQVGTLNNWNLVACGYSFTLA